ncbi:MAG TPA: platelet-activating factor acetylhydrolase IB subunit [Tepidisphaeraceae bacterium]|nr:platelet-activating factor acetylhydrolase IB subunit [Tepidisphaeraceae bacterium]
MKKLSGIFIVVMALASIARSQPATMPTTKPAPEPTDAAAIKLGRDGQPDKQFLKMHQSFLDRGKSGPIGVLFIGDSITNGWFWNRNNLNNKEIWDGHFGKYDPANFGIGGDRTAHVLWRIENGELDGIHPKVVVLMIGTNNIGYSAEEITKGDEKIVQEIHEKLPDTKLLLLGIFPRGADPNKPNVADMREKIKTINAALAKLDDGNKTRYLDIGDKFLSGDGSISSDIMPDALHPNYAGYLIWANAMQPLLDEMMK